jgi:hypothetical protein
MSDVNSPLDPQLPRPQLHALLSESVRSLHAFISEARKDARGLSREGNRRGMYLCSMLTALGAYVSAIVPDYSTRILRSHRDAAMLGDDYGLSWRYEEVAARFVMELDQLVPEDERAVDVARYERDAVLNRVIDLAEEGSRPEGALDWLHDALIVARSARNEQLLDQTFGSPA